MEYRRLAITGPIEDATPSCVIVDVARAHDYEIAIDKIVLNPKYRQKVLEALATKHVSVQWELPNRYIRNHRLHQYVNATMVKSSSLSLPTTLPLMITTTSSSTSTSTDSSSEKFTMESLFQCIQFMHSFEGVWNRQRDVDWTILDDCEPGDPTPSNFRRLNASVLYAIVRYCRISVGQDDNGRHVDGHSHISQPRMDARSAFGPYQQRRSVDSHKLGAQCSVKGRVNGSVIVIIIFIISGFFIV